MSQPPQPAAKSFFSTLFDFEFDSFITLKFAKFIYIVVLVLILGGAAIGALFAIGSAIFTGEAGAIVGAVFIGLILIPLAALFYVILMRLTLESLVVLFRIGQNTSTLIQVQSPGTPVPSFGAEHRPSGPYGGGQPPQGPPPQGPPPQGPPPQGPPPQGPPPQSPSQPSTPPTEPGSDWGAAPPPPPEDDDNGDDQGRA